MKFTVTFKDPDGVSVSLDEEARASIPDESGLSADEAEGVAEMRREKMSEFISRWIEYSEYVTIEFDTVLNTATVKERGR